MNDTLDKTWLARVKENTNSQRDELSYEMRMLRNQQVADDDPEMVIMRARFYSLGDLLNVLTTG